MKYIIFDLEFNSGKNVKNGEFINEIIEIGAVMLNDMLEETDSFSVTVKPALTKHLNKYVTKLTNISEDELKNASGFKSALKQFADWCGDDCIFSSWSNTDLYVLIENIKAHYHQSKIDFIKKYFDMQKFVTRTIPKTDNNQISLKNAAENYHIDTSKFSLHRARDDSRVCAELFRLTFDQAALSGYLSDTSGDDYYERLTFKPRFITNINDPNIDRTQFAANCPFCRRKLERISATVARYSAFLTNFRCPKCKRKFVLTVRFRQNYDSVSVKKKLKEFVKTDKDNAKPTEEKN